MFEASVLLVEWGKPETVERLRTRGSQGPDDSLGHGDHMEQERGAFKVGLKSNPLIAEGQSRGPMGERENLAPRMPQSDAGKLDRRAFLPMQ